MQRLKYFIITFIVVGAIIALLLNNKAKMEAKSENAKIEAYPVNVVEVTKSKAQRDLEMVGTITANNDVAIVSEAQGRVTKVYAEVGDYKSAGSPLIQLDDELKLAGFKTAEVNYQKTKKDYERYQALLASKAVTDAQLESATLAYQRAGTIPRCRFIPSSYPLRYQSGCCRSLYFTRGFYSNHKLS